MNFVVEYQHQHQQEDPYSNFIDSLRSEQTKYKYAYHLKRYMEFLNVKDFTSLLLLQGNNNIKNIENSIIKYIVYQRKKGYSYASITLALAAILHFYTMNDIVVNRKKIGKYIGEHVKTIKDRAYTREEIKKIVDTCDLKYKIVVTLMASSGCRIGAIPGLKLSDLFYHEKEKLYQVFFYSNTKEEYFSFTSYECAKYIDEYLEYRKRCGEILSQKSPLIRDDFIQYDLDRIIEPKHITLHALKFYLRDILIKTGIRISTPKDKKRKEISANHGFRKFWISTTVNAKMNHEIRELLAGHFIGITTAYYRPTVDEMLNEYLKVVNDLTINEENRLQKKLQQIEEQKDYQTYIIDKKIKEKDEELEILKTKIEKLSKNEQTFIELEKEGRIISKEHKKNMDAQQERLAKLEERFERIVNKIDK